MSKHRYSVEFRVFGLDPALVSRELALRPCQTRTKGDERIPGRGDPDMWAYNGTDKTEVFWGTLEEGVSFTLESLWPLREVIAKYKELGAQVIWWCGHFYSSFDGGPTLSPGLLKKLGEFGAELFIDNYFSEPSEGSSAE